MPGSRDPNPADAVLLDGGGVRASFVLARGHVVRAGVGAEAPAGAVRLDCTAEQLVVLPGEVNAHTHLYSGLAPMGMPAPTPAPENFVQILERVWWRLDRALDEASLRASARLYIAEALLAGTTTLFDHHESPSFVDGSLDVLADAAEELGIRLVVCYGATERNGGRDEGRRGLAECARFLAANRRPLVRGMVGLHASFTVSDETIREAGAMARDRKVPLHVHVAEDAADVEDAKRRGWPGPLERLRDLGALAPGSILAHGVHLDAAQVRLAEQAGAWFVQNPRSNEGNRVGYPRSLAEARRVAVGTDGYPADMTAELRALADSAAKNGDPVLPTDAQAMTARRRGGWRLAADVYVARFLPPPVVGAAADLKVVAAAGEDADALHPVAGDGGADAFELVRDLDPTPPRHVVVGGRVVVKDGVLQTGDLEAIRAEAREQAARLWSRL